MPKIQDSRKAKATAERNAAVPPIWTVPAPTSLLQTPPSYPDQLIRMPQVRELCPLSKPSLYRLIREGKFPAPISLGGGRAVAWLRREVEDFVRERIEERAAERIGQVAARDVSSR